MHKTVRNCCCLHNQSICIFSSRNVSIGKLKFFSYCNLLEYQSLYRQSKFQKFGIRNGKFSKRSLNYSHDIQHFRSKGDVFDKVNVKYPLPFSLKCQFWYGQKLNNQPTKSPEWSHSQWKLGTFMHFNWFCRSFILPHYTLPTPKIL